MSSDVSSINSQRNLNAAKHNNSRIYEFEDFRLDAARLMLYRAGEPVALKPKVVETLVALVEHAGEVISKEELMNRLWADSFVEESNLTQNIYLLRKTLGNAANGKPLIETFRRRGYRFNGQIRESSNGATEKTEVAAESNVQEKSVDDHISSADSSSVFGSLAVLPLSNESDDAQAEYLSDGITESIINRLSQISGLRVVARHTAFRFKGREIFPQEIGRELKVGAVLTGRILRLGERLVIRTELTETANGWQIWGEQYNRSVADVFEVQEIIAREISGNLHLKLTGEEEKRLSRRETKSTEAYYLYIKGRHYLNKRLTETIEQAAEFFQQAVDVDPNYALAFVGLADCYPLLSLYGRLTPHEAYPKAKAAVVRALEIDGSLAEAYNSLGVVKLFYEWDWTSAEDAFRQAIRLNPGYADAHQRYGMFLTAQRRFAEAETEFARAAELDPLSLISKTIGAYPFYYSRKFDEAVRRFGEVIAVDADYSMAHFRLGLTYAQQGEYEKAFGELQISNRLSGDRDSVAAFGYVHALAGNRGEAEAALAELERREKEGFVSAYDRALIYAGLGESETALDWLETALNERSYWLIYLKTDPALDCLRANPRFISLVEKIFGSVAEGDEKSEESAAIADTDFVQTEQRERSFVEVETAQPSVGGKNKIWYFLAGAAAFGLLILAIYGESLFLSWGKTAQMRAAQNSNLKISRLTPDVFAESPTVSPDGKRLVYAKTENDKRGVWLTDLATGSAKQIMPPTAGGYDSFQFSPDGSQIYLVVYQQVEPKFVIARIPLAGGAPQTVAANTMSPFTLSPDGKQVAFVRDQELTVANTDGSGEKVLARRDRKTGWFESWGSQLSWSPDGERIAICGGRVEEGKPRRELIEVSLKDGGEKIIPTPPDWGYIDDVQWLPDQSGLLVNASETSGSPLQIWLVSYPNGEIRRITQDFLDYDWLSISADSRLLIAHQRIKRYNIWTTSLADGKQAKQLTTGATADDGFWGVAFAPDGKIVYTSPRAGTLDLWTMNADGSNQRQLTAGAGDDARPIFTPDNRYVVFRSTRADLERIWRVDADGANLKQLTGGDGYQTQPIVSPDGNWVYYIQIEGESGDIYKVPIDGGEPVRVSAHGRIFRLFSLSPDGILLVFEQYRKEAPTPWQIGLMRADDGKVVKLFENKMGGRIQWTADSKSLVYIEHPDAANLVQQPIDGGAPHRITGFDSQIIRAFDISSDRQTIVFSRGSTSSEAVSITNFR